MQGTAAPKSTVSAQTQTEGADDDRRAQERLALVESALEGLQSVLKERDGEFKRLEGALAAAGGERDAAVQRGKDAAEELEALRSERDGMLIRKFRTISSQIDLGGVLTRTFLAIRLFGAREGRARCGGAG